MPKAPSALPRDVAVMVIHGFTATPYSVQYLADKLADRGHPVSAPTLPGHGGQPTDLDAIRWQDWADAINVEFERLARQHQHVAVTGQSLGGLLALHLAAKRDDVAAVVSLAAPLWLEGVGKRVADATGPGGWLQRVPWVPKVGGVDVRDKTVKLNEPGYKRISTKGLAQLTAFMRVVDGELESIRAPLMVIHSQQDHTAPIACAMRVASGGRARRLRVLQHSYHLIAVDVERDDVVVECAQFFDDNIAAG
jgi:carboxylesterase